MVPSSRTKELWCIPKKYFLDLKILKEYYAARCKYYISKGQPIPYDFNEFKNERYLKGIKSAYKIEKKLCLKDIKEKLQPKIKTLFSTLKIKIDIIVSDRIYLPRIKLPQHLIDIFTNTLTFINKDFYDIFITKYSQMPNSKVIPIPEKIERNIKLYSLTTEFLILPRGFVTGSWLTETLKKYGLEINEIFDYRVKAPVIDFKTIKDGFNIEQRDSINTMLKYPNGLLNSECASGKTFMGLSIASHLKQKTLIITQSDVELKNWLTEAKKHLGIKEKEISVFSTKNELIIKNFNLVNIQTLNNFTYDKMEQLNSQIGYVLVDECTSYATDLRINTLTKLKPYWFHGLSATPLRENDNRTVFLEIIFGPQFIAERINTTPVECLIIETKFTNPLDSKIARSHRKLYNVMLNDLINDDERNKLIYETLNHFILEKKQNVAIYSNRIAHCWILHDIIKEKYGKDFPVAVLVSKNKDGKKMTTSTTLIQNIKDGKYKIIIGGKKIQKALDASSISVTFITSPLKGKSDYEQLRGRGKRYKIGKEKIIEVDFADMGCPILKGQFFQRHKYRDSTDTKEYNYNK